MSNLYVDIIQPFTTSGSLTLISASFTGSLQGTASFATSASFATTASFALNAGGAVNTGSLLVTASITNATTTFTKGDGTTFSLTANNVVNADSASVATSASYALTASFALNAGTTVNTGSFLVTASAVSNVITFTKGDASTFNVTVDTGSAGAAFPYTGSAVITGSLVVTGSVTSTLGLTGSLLGTASFATSASLAQTASFYDLSAVTQNAVFSGSVRGEVRALSISSQTASLDCSLDNSFTLLLVSGSTTFLNPSNILPGQTINIRITQPSTAFGSMSFPTSIKQPTANIYTPTLASDAVDIITLISFDSSSLNLSSVKNLA
jgi:hypothetical protein